MPGERMSSPLAGLEGGSWIAAHVPYASVSPSVRWYVLSLVRSMIEPKASAEVDRSDLLPSWKAIHHPVAQTQDLLPSTHPIGERQPG